MSNKTDADFVQYLQSMVNLDALDVMTTNLANELKDSQAVMNDIKGMIDAIPSRMENISESASNPLRHEDLLSFLTSDTPQLLMPDMDVGCDVTAVDAVIASMKSYVEDIKKNFSPSTSEPTQERIQARQLDNLELEQYASNLEQLSKRLSNLKLNMKSEVDSRNAELEAKLTVLCDDVNMFTKVIQAKTTLSEANKNWSPVQQTTNALDYDNIFNRLLADINSVSYLLISKKEN